MLLLMGHDHCHKAQVLLHESIGPDPMTSSSFKKNKYKTQQKIYTDKWD